MAENNNIPEISIEEEVQFAKMTARRTSFKRHLAIFILANAFLWVVWYFLFRDSFDNTFLEAILFVLIVWLLAVILHYMIVYKWTKSYNKKELTSLKKMRLQQQEIERLKAELAKRNDPKMETIEYEEIEEVNDQQNSNLID